MEERASTGRPGLREEVGLACSSEAYRRLAGLELGLQGGLSGCSGREWLPTAVAEASVILLGGKSGEHRLPLPFQCLLNGATIPSSLAICLTSCLSQRQTE